MGKPEEKKEARALKEVQAFENLVLHKFSTNINKNLRSYVEGKGGIDKVHGVKSLSLELDGSLIIATFTADRTNEVTVVGIPLTFIRTLVFA